MVGSRPRKVPARLFVALVGALLCALLFAPGLAVAKKGRGKPTPTPTPQASPTPAPEAAEPTPAAGPQQSPPPGLDAVGERLWHYQTGDARGALGPFLGQADANGYVATAAGRVLEQEKKYGDAEARLRKATELLPDEPAAYVYLGEVYLRQKREGDASTAFGRAAELARARGGAEAAYYLGVAQQRLRKYDEAVATLQGASAPAPALIPFQIGVTRAFQGSWQAAADQLDRAIEADSGLAYAYYYRGMVQDKLGHKDRLVNDMDRFLALAPDAPEADQARAVLRAVKH
ncbi:MAG TPA: tetratricopeptide repeat protein [Thermoanaerobaculia bacterium]|nr:tetratricopeptide repeat protein [Thermoanaerobaculia bacterium]